MDQPTFLVAQGIVWLVVSFLGTFLALWVWFRPKKQRWTARRVQ